MYTFFEQLTMVIQFTILGVFTSIMIDVCTLINFKNKIITYLLQIGFWIGITYIVTRAVLVISSGYLPIYTFLFFVCGYFIYKYLLKKEFLKGINKIIKISNNNKRRIITTLIPIEFFKVLKKSLQRILKLFKRVNRGLFKIIKKAFTRVLSPIIRIFKKRKLVEEPTVDVV
jgi:hypothetical protein